MGLSVTSSGAGIQHLSRRLKINRMQVGSAASSPAAAWISLLPMQSLSQRKLRLSAFSIDRQLLGHRSRSQRSGVSCMFMPTEGSQQVKQQEFTTVADSSSASKSQTSKVVEHVVFFKVKDGPMSEELFEELRRLKSLDVISELSAGKILQILGGKYTHALHSRHPNKAAFETYAVHPFHQAVVKKLAPVVEDRLAVDWEAEPIGLPVRGGHGAARVAFIKLSDGITEEEKVRVFGFLNGLRDKFPFIRQISVGSNFSPARSKGYNMGFLALFDNVEELEQLNGNAELHAELRKSSISPFLENFLIVDIDSKYA